MIRITNRQAKWALFTIYSVFSILATGLIYSNCKRDEKCHSKGGIIYNSACYTRQSVDNLVEINLDQP